MTEPAPTEDLLAAQLVVLPRTSEDETFGAASQVSDAAAQVSARLDSARKAHTELTAEAAARAKQSAAEEAKVSTELAHTEVQIGAHSRKLTQLEAYLSELKRG